VLAGGQVATVDAFLRTYYGHALAVKLGVVAVVAALGLRHALAVRRRCPGRPSGPSLALEAGAGAVVLAVAAVLSLGAPARGPDWEGPPASAAAPSSRSGSADDLLVSVGVRPNRPGRNYVTLEVADTRRPAPAPIDEVEVSLQSPAGDIVRRPATSLGQGRYEVVGDDIDRVGAWRLLVSVQRPGLPTAVLDQGWTVADGSATRLPTLVSSQPVAPILDVAAGVAAVGSVGVAFAWRRRSGRRARAGKERSGSGRERLGASVWLPDGQPNGDGAALADDAGDADRPVVGPDDRTHRGEAEAGTADTPFPTTEARERLEDPIEIR
jgi:copper transport protein